MTQVPSTLCTLLYFLFAILLPTISTILFLPPILIFLLSNNSLLFMHFLKNILLRIYYMMYNGTVFLLICKLDDIEEESAFPRKRYNMCN